MKILSMTSVLRPHTPDKHDIPSSSMFLLCLKRLPSVWSTFLIQYTKTSPLQEVQNLNSLDIDANEMIV